MPRFLSGSKRAFRRAITPWRDWSSGLKRLCRFDALKLLLLSVAVLAGTVSPVSMAEAQFFFRWLEDRPRERTKKPKPPKPTGTKKPSVKRPASDDLPPIVPPVVGLEESTPPPPDVKPYDEKLLRLAVILGALHYLRELCGADEGQLWRQKMEELVTHEGTTAIRRAKLVSSFNEGYRAYSRTYRTCTESAATATRRFVSEGGRIAADFAYSPGYGRDTTGEVSVETATPLQSPSKGSTE
jgi:uncharacterized protein (TIGR02301 family)